MFYKLSFRKTKEEILLIFLSYLENMQKIQNIDRVVQEC